MPPGVARGQNREGLLVPRLPLRHSRGCRAALERRRSGVHPRARDPRSPARPHAGASRGSDDAGPSWRKRPSPCRSRCAPTPQPAPRGAPPSATSPPARTPPEQHARQSHHRGPGQPPGVPTPHVDGAASDAASGGRARSSRARCHASARNEPAPHAQTNPQCRRATRPAQRTPIAHGIALACWPCSAARFSTASSGEREAVAQTRPRATMRPRLARADSTIRTDATRGHPPRASRRSPGPHSEYRDPPRGCEPAS